MASPDTPIVHFYGDASSHRGHTYMVSGGLVIKNERITELEQKIAELKAACNFDSEMKWTYYKGDHRKDAYLGAVDYLFSMIEEKKAHFHTLICDFNAFDHARDGPKRPERSVNKMYFQLLLHRVCRLYGPDAVIHFFPDHGQDSAEIVDFRGVICAEAYRRYRTKPNCLRSIQPMNSRQSAILQVVDIVVGAIAAKRENRELGPAKTELADYVLARSPVDCWSNDTARAAKRFTVWNFVPRA